MELIPNIIHNKENKVRYEHVLKQMKFAGIGTFKFSPAFFLDCPKTSVMEAHKQIIRDNYDEPELIIFEDDIVFTQPHSFERFLELKDKLPSHWDVFLGSYYKISKKVDVSPEVDLLRWGFNGLHHYAIKKKFYDTFLALPSGEHVDRAVGNTGAMVYAPKLLLSRQMDGDEGGFSERLKRKNNYKAAHSRLKYY